MPHLLALDAGTTSVRAVVFSDAGEPVALAQREITQHYPRLGWVEHDPCEILRRQLEVARAALDTARLQPRDVAGIGITNQRETVVVWDRATGEPVYPAIVWQDRRTAGRCDELRAAGCGDEIRAATGLELDAYFTATKLEWVLRHTGAAGDLAFGTVDSWLVWNLTGAHVTDASNASRTMLYHLGRGEWDPALLDRFGVPAAMLPAVRSSSEVYGEATVDGLAGIPVAGIAGDQQAALFGQRCFAPGQAKNTYGTGCFLLQNSGAEPVASASRLLSTVAWRLGSETTYALEGSVFVGGAVVQWLRDELRLAPTAAGIDALAATVPDSGGVVLVPAFVGLGAPHWDPYARGAILGLTRDTTAAHLCRAALESIALQTADLLDAVAADTGRPLPELRADGGAARSDLLMQIQADLLGVPVVRPAMTETTALGAAYLAGLATGVWPGLEQLAGQSAADRVFTPSQPAEQVADLRARWREAVRRAGGWAS